MAIGKTNAGAGGSGGVNFRVVGGLTQPTSPKENTIWVRTDIDIPYWTTTAPSKTPAYVAEKGVVTFWWESATDTEVSGTTAAGFMPVKYKATNPPGNMRLKPINCYQNQDGTAAGWKPKEAYIYKGGEWVQFSSETLYLYISGDECKAITGGWVSAAVALESGTNAVAPNITRGATTMTINVPSHGGGIVRTANKVDLASVATLTLLGSFENSGNAAYLRMFVWTAIGSYHHSNAAASVVIKPGSSATLDVSGLTGAYYIGFGLYSTSVKIVMSQLSGE